MSRKQQTIAITGATGFLGSVLVDHFAERGWQVTGLIRNPKNHTHKLPNVTYKAYDITRPLAPHLLQNVDVVIHAAYIKASDKTRGKDPNIMGAERLVKAIEASSVGKAIFISSMSAHEAAISQYGIQKLTIEALFQRKNDVVLRPGLIIGNGGIVKQMSTFMRTKHAVPLIGGGTQPLQIINVYDLAELIEIVITKRVSGTFIAATPTVYTYKQFYQALARFLGVKVVYIPVPFTLLMALFQTFEILHIPLGVGKDNLLGLKMLRSTDSQPGLQKIGITLSDLPTALKKSGIR